MLSKILKEKKYFLPKHSHDGGATKETHFVIYNGKKYVLRICNDKKSQIYCHEAFNHLSNKNILPNLIEEKNNYFLIEFIKGRDLHEEEPESFKNIEQVGKILAQVNMIKENFNYKKSLKKYISYLSDKKVLSPSELIKIRQYLNKLRKVKLKTCLDISDLTADNLRVRNNQVFLVDIGAIKPKFAGFGITKAFFQWIKKPKQRKFFEKGYSSISSMKFYSGEYKKLTQLFFIIQVLYYKHFQGRNYYSYLSRLRCLISGQEL